MKRGKDQIPMLGGDEYAMLTDERKFLHHKAGEPKRAKKSFNKRLRKSQILITKRHW